ncbi:DNA polymerase IV, partial [Acinetobacter baumannii]
LQHSKSFKNPIHSQQDLTQVLFLLLNAMHIPENFQFRLIGIGGYQLQTKAEDVKVYLW